MPDLYLTTFRGEVTVCKDGEEDVTVSEREACRRILAHDALVAALRGFLRADPDVFADELGAARAALKI
jgi:hypothetical protein